MMRTDLNLDPNPEIQILLRIIAFSFNATAVGALPPPPSIPISPSASATVVWSQCILYASMVCSLFAALGAVMGKQWLDHYKSVGERGSLEARGMERHRKFIALEAWHFRGILESIPVLLQASLLLFAVSLSAYMWDVERIIAEVLIVTNSEDACIRVVSCSIPPRLCISAFFHLLPA